MDTGKYNKERKRFQRGHRVQRRQGGKKPPEREFPESCAATSFGPLLLPQEYFCLFCVVLSTLGAWFAILPIFGGLGLLGLECKILYSDYSEKKCNPVFELATKDY